MNVLTTHDLSVHYGTVLALHGVDLRVAPGELVALVGRNGAGKSSLLAALAGAVAYHGQACWSVRRDQIAYVPQRAHPRWDMPLEVRQVVAAGCLRGRGWWRRPGPAERSLVDAALARLGLTDIARTPVRALSGGQAQRVLLARALTQQPRVLLLDEPYDGLDKVNVASLNAVVGELAAQGVTVVAAVHELNVVRTTFARVIGLDGCVVRDGKPDEVFTSSGLCELFGIGAAA